MSTTRKAAYGAAALLFAAAGVTAATGTAAAAPSAEPKPYHCGSGWLCENGGSGSYVYADAWKGGHSVDATYSKSNGLIITDYFKNHHYTVAWVKVAGSGTAKFYGPKKPHHRRTVPLHYSAGKSIKVKVCTSSSPHAVCSHYSPAGRT